MWCDRVSMLIEPWITIVVLRIMRQRVTVWLENRNIPIYVCSYTTTAPRLSRKCESGRHKYFDCSRMLLCRNDFIWRGYSTKWLLLLHTYPVEVSIRPHAQARYFCISPPLVLGSAHIPHTVTGLVSPSPIRKWGNKLVYSWLDCQIVFL